MGGLFSSLGARLFLITALLIGGVTAIIVGVTRYVGNEVNQRAIERAISASQDVQRSMQSERLRELELISQLLAGDPAFVGYVAAAQGGGLTPDAEVDSASIRDLLAERQRDLGFDFAIVLDTEGQTLAQTDAAVQVRRDLSSRPLVASALERLSPTSGLWRNDDGTYQAAAVPLARANALVGLLVTGLRLDDELARDISSASDADVAYLMPSDAGVRVSASTLAQDARSALTAWLDRDRELLAEVLERQQTVTRRNIPIGTATWAMRLSPLTDVDGTPQGAMASLVSEQKQTVGFDRIRQLSLLAGAIAILVALLATALALRSVLKPIARLSEAVETASRGDVDTPVDPNQPSELRRLSGAFRRLLAGLRERNEIDNYVHEISSHLPRLPELGATPSQPSFDTRVSGESSGGEHDGIGDGGQTLLCLSAKGERSLDQRMEQVEQLVMKDQGEIFNQLGELSFVRFVGDNGVLRAIRSLARIADVSGGAIDRAVISHGRLDEELVRRWNLSARVLHGDAADGLLQLLARVPAQQVALTAEAVAALKKSVPSLAVPDKGNATLSMENVQRIRADSDSQGHLNLDEVVPGVVLGGRYEVVSFLGVGGMGRVFKAHDRELGEAVALKMLRRDIANRGEEVIERLKAEIRAARRISHPNVVRTFDFGQVDGLAYVSMEYVRGVTLQQALKTAGRVPLNAGLNLARQICDGVGAAHQAGVLHRDLKPGNLILEFSGTLKLMDFGVAHASRSRLVRTDSSATFEGTPAYVSPEQAQGLPASAQSDIYSLGILLCELFTGRTPIGGSDTQEICINHIQMEPAKPSEFWPQIPPRLEEIILRCLQKKPADRYPTAEAINHDLRQVG